MKETISKVKRQPSEWEKIIVNKETDRRRRVRCVLALERTQGPSRAFSILGAK